MSSDYVLLLWEVVCIFVSVAVTGTGMRRRNGQSLGGLSAVLLSPLNKNKQAGGAMTATGNSSGIQPLRPRQTLGFRSGICCRT